MQTPLSKILGVLTLIGGAALLVTLTGDILHGEVGRWNNTYLAVQLAVCIILLCDFFVRMYEAPNRSRYFVRNLFVLLIAIPYLNIVHLAGLHLSREAYLVLKCIPLIRSFWMIWLVVMWLGRGRKALCLLWSYILSATGVAYIAALIFYAYESGVNPHVDSFGNSVWWAWMCLSTAGAAVFPVTTIGKVMAAALPCIGMMIFPVFTVYFTSIVSHSAPPSEP
ncbi:MAG: two pore domain potassium channel family protein [Rikenellaceae bacterium]|nr:two pore domain potassium channel family protein [Rikenellaceae bacterium]